MAYDPSISDPINDTRLYGPQFAEVREYSPYICACASPRPDRFRQGQCKTCYGDTPTTTVDEVQAFLPEAF